MNRFYYASVAPVIVKNQVIAGVSGDDMDNPGYLPGARSGDGRDEVALVCGAAEGGRSGRRQLAEHRGGENGGGMTWTPVTYDPDLNLIFVTTGNPQPVIAYANRAGANLFTGSIVALNADTGVDGLVFSVVAARHARLGFDADRRRVRRAVQRSAAKAHRAGRAQRPLLRARSDERQGAGLDRVRERRTGRPATMPPASRFRIPRRCRRLPARSCRRIRAAAPTGSRRRSARARVCST